jgi:hypothetical protein
MFSSRCSSINVRAETKFLLVVRVIKSKALRWAGYVMCEAKFCLDNLMEGDHLGNLGISGRNAVLGKMNWVELMHDTGTD